MSKTGTATVDMQGVKKQKDFDRQRENVSAAIDALDNVSQTAAKSTAIVKRRIEELDELVMEYDERLRLSEVRHQQELQEHKDQYTRDTTMLQTKLAGVEEKLRKVQQTLA